MEWRREPPPGYKTQSPDIEYWVEDFQFDHYRAMTIEQRVEVMQILNRREYEREMAVIRAAFPHAGETELELRLAARRYGSDLIRKLTGFDADAV